ncbi:MAG TPA: hypothetical protein VNJ01_15415 [Bacteriovoracaceae bacterium]|nr:hypothetical protein [Bacteriovoracaceae bacterium]
MSQKGEASLLAVSMLLAMSALFVLLSLELRSSYLQLQRRTNLFLCTKEVKGELHRHLKFMGRTNWGINNVKYAALILIFIPGMQGVAVNHDKVKKLLQSLQALAVLSYLKTFYDLRQKGCPLEPRLYITPFELGGAVLRRDEEGAAILRKEKWSYYFYSKPYVLELEIDARDFEGIYPEVRYKTSEKAARLSSHLSSAW